MAKEETQAVKAEDSMSTAPTPEVATPEPKMVTIELDTMFINNGNTVQTYGPGQVTVDEDTAQDLLRRQREVHKGDEMRLNGMDRTSGKIGEI